MFVLNNECTCALHEEQLFDSINHKQSLFLKFDAVNFWCSFGILSV